MDSQTLYKDISKVKVLFSKWEEKLSYEKAEKEEKLSMILWFVCKNDTIFWWSKSFSRGTVVCVHVLFLPACPWACVRLSVYPASLLKPVCLYCGAAEALPVALSSTETQTPAAFTVTDLCLPLMSTLLPSPWPQRGWVSTNKRQQKNKIK